MMNTEALRFSGGRSLDDSVFARLRKEGGLGVQRGPSGEPVKFVGLTPDGKVMVNYYKQPKKPKLLPEQKEHQDFLENLMERERSGHHNAVKPSDAKRAGKRLDNFVDEGRKLQGVDV
jgi:hypothetical protein